GRGSASGLCRAWTGCPKACRTPEQTPAGHTGGARFCDARHRPGPLHRAGARPRTGSCDVAELSARGPPLEGRDGHGARVPGMDARDSFFSVSGAHERKPVLSALRPRDYFFLIVIFVAAVLSPCFAVM